MMTVVIDTNVAVVANGDHQSANDDCRLSCIRRIRDVVRSGVLVLDDRDLIFEEYRRNLDLRGQPGVGDAFVKWVHDNRFNLKYCQRIAITPRDGYGEDYEEFPEIPAHAGFSR